jgi:hypothetical protein
MLEHLKRWNRGRTAVITGMSLHSILFGYNKNGNRYIAKLCRELRSEGILVGSVRGKPPGYFWPITDQEKEDVLAELKQTARAVLSVYWKCLKRYRIEKTPQRELAL